MVSSSFSTGGVMSEERFDEIDRRFDRLTANVTSLQADVTNLQTDVTNLQADVTVLKTDVAGLKTETVDLRRHMGVLHEDVIDRIRGIREDDSLRLEMRAGFAMIMKRLDDHTVPGDAADRAFAATLADHEKRIASLEGAS
jgi:outer membrane murein-binding lipoprotein Lpp